MTQSQHQLVKKHARLRRLVLVIYGVVAGAVSIGWILYARAASDCSVAAPCVQTGTPLSGADWSLAFSDEFNGPSLDASKWSTGRWAATTTGDEPYGAKKEGAYFTSANVNQSGGSANIKLTGGQQTINGVTYHYASGEINTEHKFYLKPGDYVEARVKIPQCSGCWPAFWMIPSGKVPPEMDIYEFFNTLVRGRPSFNYHYDNGSETGVTPYGEPGADYRNNYHIYGLYWTGSTAIPFLDGKPYPVGLGATTSQPQFMIFNLSTYVGTSPAAATLSIDWVRAWEPAAPAAAAGSPASSQTPAPNASPSPASPNLPAASPAPTSASARAGAQTPTVAVVSGVYTAPAPAANQPVSVKVDGTPSSSGLRINTTLLTNGEHTVTVQLTGKTGAASTVTHYIIVNNRLSLFAWVRNQIFSPFHGNAIFIVVANVLIMLLAGGGAGVMWYCYLPHLRTRPVGLAI